MVLEVLCGNRIAFFRFNHAIDFVVVERISDGPRYESQDTESEACALAYPLRLLPSGKNQCCDTSYDQNMLVFFASMLALTNAWNITFYENTNAVETIEVSKFKLIEPSGESNNIGDLKLSDGCK